GIIIASIIGFLIGIGRLSQNWLIRKICMVYVEIFRNIPPLLVIFFWYFGVLSVLPQARESLSLPFGTYINNRGFFFPAFVWGEGSGFIGIAFMVGIVATFLIALWSRRRRMATGQALHTVRWAF